MAIEQIRTSDGGLYFVLRSNAGLYWRTTLWVYIALSTICLTIAFGFTLAGYWPILPFAGLEIVALGAALYVSANRGNSREVVSIDGNIVEIAKGLRGPERSWVFDRIRSEVALKAPLHRWYPSRLVIRFRGTAVELGAFLTDGERESLAAELQHRIGPMAVPGSYHESRSSLPVHADHKQ
ncbi:MAG: DUF2244 domain-containing protein [Aquisalimonadaceae bacterium]